MQKPSLRRAEESDLDAIRGVLRAAYTPFIESLPDLPDVAALTEKEFEKSDVTVAELDGVLIGVAVAATRPPVAHLANLAVHPNAAGKGIGRALIDHVTNAARGNGCKELVLATHPLMPGNVDLYRHLGWNVTELTPRKIVMSRKL